MIVTCPACHTDYNVPLTALPPQGRKVRCKNCGHAWVEGAPPDDAISALAAADAVPPPPASLDNIVTEKAEPLRPAPVQPSRPAAANKKPTKDPVDWMRLGAAAAFVLVTVLGAMAIFREPLVRSAPLLEPYFAKVGLAAGNVDDWFERVELVAEPAVDGEKRVLRVRGEYRNVYSLPRQAPEVRVFWRTHSGELGPVVSVPMIPQDIAPGARGSFEATLTDLDLTAGGDAGAVLAGGRYDYKLALLQSRDTKPDAPPPHKKEPADEAPTKTAH